MPTDKNRLSLTIICPVYNEEEVVALFFPRMKAVMDELSKTYDVDLVFSNNASADRTLQELMALRATNPNVYIITLSCNVGYQRSMECALRTCSGDIFVFIDVDGEDPPELILKFVEHYENEAYDIVYGERADRDELLIVKAMRKAFYRLLKAVSDEDVILDMAEFLLMTKAVRDAVINDRSSFPFIRASIARVGFKRTGIAYKRQRRLAGGSHFNFFGMTKFAVAGILASSTLLLRLPLYTLPIWLLIAALFTWEYIVVGDRLSIALLALSMFVYIGCTISFIAIYVGRAYKNSLCRPNFIIDHKNSILQTDIDP